MPRTSLMWYDMRGMANIETGAARQKATAAPGWWEKACLTERWFRVASQWRFRAEVTMTMIRVRTCG